MARKGRIEDAVEPSVNEHVEDILGLDELVAVKQRGDVVGFDIDHASRKLDLSGIETIALPPESAVEGRARRSRATNARTEG